MRIAVDVRPLCVPTFGIGRYTRSLLDRLTLEPNIDWFLYADRPLLHDYSNRQHVTQRSFPQANRLKSLYRTQYIFSRWAQDDQVDIYWSPRHHLPTALPSRIKALVTVHDLVWKSFPDTMQLANRMAEQLLMPRSLARADHIVCVSNATRSELLGFYPELESKVSVVLEAAERLDMPHRNMEQGVPYFLFVGTLEPRKNLPRLIQAFARVRQRYAGPVRLDLVGAQGWGEGLATLLSEYDLEDSVVLHGHVDEQVLHSLLAGAVALCLPSLHEGFGLPALEAMHYGTPVIGSLISAIKEVVGDGGILVDPHDIGGFADAMCELLDNEQLRKKLGQKALVASRRFSWDDAAMQILSTFHGMSG